MIGSKRDWIISACLIYTNHNNYLRQLVLSKLVVDLYKDESFIVYQFCRHLIVLATGKTRITTETWAKNNSITEADWKFTSG